MGGILVTATVSMFRDPSIKAPSTIPVDHETLKEGATDNSVADFPGAQQHRDQQQEFTKISFIH